MVRHPIEDTLAMQPSSAGGWLLCVSGGADSMAMLHAAVRSGCKGRVAHCNFGLRGEESDRDERLVREVSAELGMACDVRRFDTVRYCEARGLSIEMGCRELRYEWFRRLMGEHGLSRIVVAHNADDNTETMLLNLLRGTGIRGLVAMREDSGEILRPLLRFSRAEIEEYLRVIGGRWVVDSTNLSSDFKRNFLRNEVIPLLRSRWEGLDGTLTRTREHLYDTQKLAEESLRNYLLGVDCLLPEALISSCPAPETLIYEWLKEKGINSAMPREMLRSAHGAGWSLPSGRVERIRAGLLYTPADASGPPVSLVVEVLENTPDNRRLILTNTSQHTLYCSPDADLRLRPALAGDVIAPFGMRGRRMKVKKALKEAGLSPSQRDAFLLVADAEDNVVWLPGIKRSTLYPVTPDSSQILRIILRYE